MPKILVISPSVAKESAKLLAKALKADWENPYKTKHRDFTPYEYVFKYGFSRPIKSNKVFNKTIATNKARDKLVFFELFKKDDITVLYTTEKEKALAWIKQGGCATAREFSKENNGKGLKFCTTEEDLDKFPAKFWTAFEPHTHEFRVNVWRDKVVSIYNKEIKNGFFKFTLYQGQEEQPQLVAMVKMVWDKLGLDWCGLDILCTEGGKLYLLEVNSAPILFPFTINKLVKLIKKEIE